MAQPSVKAPDRTATPDPEQLIPSQRQRRDRILQSALRLLQRQDYDQILMKDVAAGADVAIGTVYRYFPSKERLFAEALVQWSQQRQERAGDTPIPGDTPAERLKAAYHLALRAFERRPGMYRAQFALLASRDPEVEAVFKVFQSRTRQRFVDALEGLSTADIDAVNSVMNAVLVESLSRWSLGRTDMASAHAAIDRAVDLIFSAPPGSRG
ncbi:MAG: TetR/AcrR family transcriptional regulator [Acidimicrobiia bacterium]